MSRPKGIPMSEEQKELRRKKASLKTRQKMADTKIQKIKSGEIVLFWHDKLVWNKGIPWSDEIKKQMSKSRLGTEPWNKGLTAEIDKRVENNAKKNKGKVRSPEIKAQMSRVRKEKFDNGDFDYLRTIVSQTAINTFLSGKIKNTLNTKPELEAKQILEKYGIEYEHQYRINNRIFDFYLPEYNTLIEIDGIFWHGKGIEDKDLKYKSQQKVRQSDKLKKKLAEKNGYQLCRYWQDELNLLEDYCKRAVNYKC